MSTRYANLDADTNKLLGWYSDSKHKTIPDNSIAVTDAVWKDCIENNYNYYDPDTETFSTKDFRTTDEIEQAKLKVEYKWAASELSNAQTDLMFFWTGDSRAVGTENEWKAYMCALRDYASVTSDGVYSTADISAKTYTYDSTVYTVTVDSDTGRPVAPSDSVTYTTTTSDS